jgi:MFS family permease
MCIFRAVAGFFMRPVAAIGSAVVTEVFFQKSRALYMGLWTLMVTLGVRLAPPVMGFVSERVGHRWIHWIPAIVSPLFSTGRIRHVSYLQIS